MPLPVPSKGTCPNCLQVLSFRPLFFFSFLFLGMFLLFFLMQETKTKHLKWYQFTKIYDGFLNLTWTRTRISCFKLSKTIILKKVKVRKVFNEIKSSGRDIFEVSKVHTHNYLLTWIFLIYRGKHNDNGDETFFLK